jgi:hypothetical protein
MVIGTGQNGTWILAEMVSRMLPITASTIARTVVEPAAGDQSASASVACALPCC